jgi:SH3-like domain-containing protein
LNVRAGPNAQIIAAHANGSQLTVLKVDTFDGKKWAHVRTADGLMGWALRQYIDCGGANARSDLPLAAPASATCQIADPSGAPLNLREAPNGAIVGAEANNATVRLLRELNVGGRPWALITTASGLSGWVYRPYLRC